MAKYIKLPGELKEWKVVSFVSEAENSRIYKVSKKDYDGSVINGVLRHIAVQNDDYNGEIVDYYEDEADFLNSVSDSGDCFTYIEIVTKNEPAKEKFDFYLISEDLKSLAEIMKIKSYSDCEIVDFGIQMSAMLEMLEAKNIYHGNLSPENIYVTADGKYKLGGFSDCESKINDLSFVAPEIYKKEKPDFTTDIYSLGLIMYAMCNNNKLPFEKDGTSKDKAIEMRLSGKAVAAPQGGVEKLKSVIVIACQPENANRWKNAGNIKNALTSIKNELGDNLAKVENPEIIAPAATDFSDNVFEEYEYEEFEEPANEPTNEAHTEAVDEIVAEKAVEDNAEPEIEAEAEAEELASDEESESGFEVVEVTDVEQPANEAEQSSENSAKSFDVFDNEDVFDEFAVSKKVEVKPAKEEKDYGAYFDDEPVIEKDTSVKKDNVNDTEFKNNGFTEKKNDNNVEIVDFEYDDENEAENEKGKKNVAIIVVCALIVLAVLVFVVFCIFNGINTNKNTEATTSPSESTSIETTVPATTAAPTTQPTTAAAKVKVTPVVGYGYSYGKELLEQEGFTVEISEYRESDTYDEGYIIEQTPEGDAESEKGSVIKLVISTGRTEDSTDAPDESSTSDNSDDDFVFADSDSAYLSSAQVHSLSNSDLQHAINEIYARRGRIFEDSDLAAYFNSKSWYEGIYTAAEFDNNVKFNTYEQKNLSLLIDERDSR